MVLGAAHACATPNIHICSNFRCDPETFTSLDGISSFSRGGSLGVSRVSRVHLVKTISKDEVSVCSVLTDIDAPRGCAAVEKHPISHPTLMMTVENSVAVDMVGPYRQISLPQLFHTNAGWTSCSCCRGKAVEGRRESGGKITAVTTSSSQSINLLINPRGKYIGHGSAISRFHWWWLSCTQT